MAINIRIANALFIPMFIVLGVYQILYKTYLKVSSCMLLILFDISLRFSTFVFPKSTSRRTSIPELTISIWRTIPGGKPAKKDNISLSSFQNLYFDL